VYFPPQYVNVRSRFSVKMKSKGESQRIYWQQWLSSKHQNSRRELITSSAAIRISPDAAKAKDVTKLLRDTLKLSSFHEDGYQDSLVLVGTLYSLPADYVQFEHETPRASPRDGSSVTVISSSQSDPFHIIKTLAPEDNPLATRDKMMQHLKQVQERAPASGPKISPKVQWYFVPSSSSESPIPNCIELDGYCSSIEEDCLESDDDSSVNNQTEKDDTSNSDDAALLFNDPDLMFARCPFLNTEETPGTDASSHLDKRSDQEFRRYNQLSQSMPAGACISGYLLKRSNVDPHVWRRVHCVLTGDYLWYVSRVPYCSATTTGTRIAKKHGRIALDRALLLEPTSDYKNSPLYRIPNSFEVVTSRGTSHAFRATNTALQRHWLRALSTKILDAFENSLMAHAELIVADECVARNKRFSSFAVKPLWDEDDRNNPLLVNVLRLGMEISEYREQCRHVKAFLPAKKPVVVMSESPRKRSTDHEQAPPEPLDKETKQLVQAAWDAATSLLARCTHVAVQLHNDDHNKHISRSLETLCRHVDYVITGQHRSLSSQGNFESNNGGGKGSRHDQDPPPMDLFDKLLAELQSLVKSCQQQSQESKS
jgi:hypothetical protein